MPVNRHSSDAGLPCSLAPGVVTSSAQSMLRCVHAHSSKLHSCLAPPHNPHTPAPQAPSRSPMVGPWSAGPCEAPANSFSQAVQVGPVTEMTLEL